MSRLGASRVVQRPLRIFCVEDNPLLVMHLQAVIEDAGHVFAGSAARFDDLMSAFDLTDFDLALVDFDLADGRTGGLVTEWLQARGRPSLFLTGQEQLAGKHAAASLGTIVKPVSEEALRSALENAAKRLAR
jgi:DNA-binding response OmpR family regulator